jgi:DNA-binding IclR family transcriptional regulator
MQNAAARGTAVESVMRATRLLGCFRPGEPSLSLSELVRRSGYSKTTTYRLLRTLEEAGWLERDDISAFRLTFRLFEIGSILIDSLDLRPLGRPVMKRLSQQSGLSVHLVVPAGAEAVCIERVDPAQHVRILHLDVGSAQPLHQRGAPRALLAHDEATLLPELLSLGLEAKGPTCSRDDLVDDLAVTRRRGYSLDSRAPVATIGAPVFDRTGRAVAGLGVSGLREQVLSPGSHLTDTLLRAAEELSTRLGADGSLPWTRDSG